MSSLLSTRSVSLQAMETEEVPMDTEEDNTEIGETMKHFLAAAGNHFLKTT